MNITSQKSVTKYWLPSAAPDRTRALFPTCGSSTQKSLLFLATILFPSFSASAVFRTRGKSWLGHRPSLNLQLKYLVHLNGKGTSPSECCASIKHLFVVAHTSGETLSRLAVWKPRGLFQTGKQVLVYCLCLFLGTLIKGVRAVQQQSVCNIFPTTIIKSALCLRLWQKAW